MWLHRTNDRMGQIFGKLTVIGKVPKNSGRLQKWLCKCECGGEKIVAGADLKMGRVKSCGCLHRSVVPREKFGKLTAIKKSHKTVHGTWMWICQCECGNKKTVNTSSLTSGTTTSCGCAQKLPYGVAALKSVYKMYIKSAKERNYELKLSLDEFKKITGENCYYCGREPSNERKVGNSTGKYVYNGIDRIDNNKGYIPRNIVPCCLPCNKAKSTLTTEQFFDMVKRIYIKMKLGDPN